MSWNLFIYQQPQSHWVSGDAIVIPDDTESVVITTDEQVINVLGEEHVSVVVQHHEIINIPAEGDTQVVAH